MNDLYLLHKPQWNVVGNEWHMIVGNQRVARIETNFDPRFPRYKWLSAIEDGYADYGWHAVDFETLDTAKHDLEQWWLHMCRGEGYQPRLHCPLCLSGAHPHTA